MGKKVITMGKKGLEPPTLRLSGVYSYHLSYLPEKKRKYIEKTVFPPLFIVHLTLTLPYLGFSLVPFSSAATPTPLPLMGSL
jgi:hypothetical protein